MSSSASDQVRLVVVGDGAERDRLLHLARPLGERVLLLGTRHDVPDLLRAMDVFCLSSRTEGLPLVVPEAMASGLPVVATAVGGLPGIVPPSVGSLVAHGDERALRDAIRQIADDPARRAAMSRAAHAWAHERFSLDRMTAAYERLYRA